PIRRPLALPTLLPSTTLFRSQVLAVGIAVGRGHRPAPGGDRLRPRASHRARAARVPGVEQHQRIAGDVQRPERGCLLLPASHAPVDACRVAEAAAYASRSLMAQSSQHTSTVLPPTRTWMAFSSSG